MHVRVAFLLLFVGVDVVQATEYYVATPKSGGKHIDATLWENGLSAQLCTIDSMDIALNKYPSTKIDPKTGKPPSCARGVVAQLQHGTKVREITPPGECSTRKKDEYRRVRVLTGEHQDKIGCLNQGTIASEPIP